METLSEVTGLCAGCELEASCMYRAHATGTIYQCEEFRAASAPAHKRRVSARAQSESSDDEGSTKLVGLCSNCDNRATCTYPKPEAGVWRCEEYA